MTADQLSKLTPDEKRAKIAEKDGFTPFLMTDGGLMDPPRWVKGKWSYPIESLPDYLNDLNAMHEAEKTFRRKPHAYVLFCDYLVRVCNPGCDRLAKEWTDDERANATFAEPHQRADAFILTACE